MTKKDETTKEMARPSFITETTSQEEGVFVGMDLTDRNVLTNDNALSENRKSTPKKEGIDDDVAGCDGARHNSGCQATFPTEENPPRKDEKATADKVVNSSRGDGDGQPNRSTALTVPSSRNNDDVSKVSAGYYTTAPHVKAEGLSFLQSLREYRHTPCFMTPLSTMVLLAVLCSSLVSLLFIIPQFMIGLLLGPLVRRQFWLVEFFYRWDVVGWGHIKLLEMVGKRNNCGSNSSTGKGGETKNGTNHHSNRGSTPASTHRTNNAKKKLQHLGLLGHSDTLHQRITVVPRRVYIHPIPQFVDNVCYLVVCLPSNDSSVHASMAKNNDVCALPIIGMLIDCGEAKRTLAYIECIYELYYEAEYPRCKYYGSRAGEDHRGMGIEIHAILSTHRHHDHTAGVGDLVMYLEEARLEISDDVLISGGCAEDESKRRSDSVYGSAPGKVIVVGGAVESVPHCNLFVKNECFVPLPCVSIIDGNGDILMVNDMNSLVSIECIGVPSHTRGSIVYALRNRSAPGISGPTVTHALPRQTHLFTGDAIFSGGGGVPFEADLEYPQDNFMKNPNKLKTKNGSSSFRAGAGVLSMERCFTEVLTRVATRMWREEPFISSKEIQSRTLLYPGHEYTTELLMRQFDPKTIPFDGHWTRMAPSVFFATASHFYVSAHKRALPQGQKLLSLPTPLDKEMIVNPNFRSLKRRGENLINALRLWHEFGAKNKIPPVEVATNNLTAVKKYDITVPFRTLYAEDLDTLVEDLRSGSITAATAADRIELLQSRVDEKLIGRRPIPNHLPSHKNVYLGILALVILGSPPSAVTVSDSLVMALAAPVDSNDLLLISKKRLIAALGGLGLIPSGECMRLEDIISLLWTEARLDDESSQKANTKNNGDIESIADGETDDLIELGMLKLALFGVSLYQPSWFAKYCLPCRNPKPVYCKTSWTTKSNMKRTSGELVKHDADKCSVCQNFEEHCCHSVYI